MTHEQKAAEFLKAHKIAELSVTSGHICGCVGCQAKLAGLVKLLDDAAFNGRSEAAGVRVQLESARRETAALQARLAGVREMAEQLDRVARGHAPVFTTVNATGVNGEPLPLTSAFMARVPGRF